MRDEVKDLRRRVSMLERLVINLVTIERIPKSKLNSEQKKLLELTMTDIERGDYRDYLTVEELRKTLSK